MCTLLSSQSFEWHGDVIAVGVAAVVVAVVDQHCSLPAVWAAGSHRLMTAAHNSQRAAVGSGRVPDLSQDLDVPLKTNWSGNVVIYKGQGHCVWAVVLRESLGAPSKKSLGAPTLLCTPQNIVFRTNKCTISRDEYWKSRLVTFWKWQICLIALAY